MCHAWRAYCDDFFFFKQKTAYEMRISDWSSDVCSSDLSPRRDEQLGPGTRRRVSSRGGPRRCVQRTPVLHDQPEPVGTGQRAQGTGPGSPAYPKDPEIV